MCAKVSVFPLYALTCAISDGTYTFESFLNPWIYKTASQWNDIAKGSSSGCTGFDDGWPAVAGWDAVTGVGTPNYKNLVAA